MMLQPNEKLERKIVITEITRAIMFKQESKFCLKAFHEDRYFFKTLWPSIGIADFQHGKHILLSQLLWPYKFSSSFKTQVLLTRPGLKNALT